MSSPMSTSTIIASTLSSATATPTSTGSAPGTNGHSSSSPLLFFVALGFGVLFTNLWIIIGVKYCFRYQNARRRGIPMNGPDGLAMGNMHGGRRRREKKLMTTEEVETQFPQMTYKAWRAQREIQGLSTEGGVQAVGQEEAQQAREALSGGPIGLSRAPSIRTVQTQRPSSLNSIEPADTIGSGVYEVSETEYHDKATAIHKEKDTETPISKGSAYEKRSSMAIERETKDMASPITPTSPTFAGTNAADHESHTFETAPSGTAADEAEVDEAELAHLPDDIGAGDTCAICIDQLEDDDEVRGLTCGHAFHCSCVDVWLTTRRAICPLCKKDFWVRKAPPTDANAVETEGDVAPAHTDGHPLNGALPPWRTNFLARRFMQHRARSAAARTDLENNVATTPADGHAMRETGR